MFVIRKMVCLAYQFLIEWQLRDSKAVKGAVVGTSQYFLLWLPQCGAPVVGSHHGLVRTYVAL